MQVFRKLWYPTSDLPDQPPKYCGGSSTIFGGLVAEKEYHWRMLLLQFVGDIDGDHCLSSTGASRYPKTIAFTLSPQSVVIVACNPLTSSRDPVALVRDEIRSIDRGVTEEQGISASL